MNTRRGRAKFNNSLTILDSGYIPAMLMGSLVEKLSPEKDAVMQWHMTDGYIDKNLKVKVYSTLP